MVGGIPSRTGGSQSPLEPDVISTSIPRSNREVAGISWHMTMARIQTQPAAQRITLADGPNNQDGPSDAARPASAPPATSWIVRLAKGYENTVEELLHPLDQPDLEIEDLIRRYHVDQKQPDATGE